MRSVTTYLHFDTNCREAMQFYGQSLGAELQITPAPDAQGRPSSEPNAPVMHSQLWRDGRLLLQASDNLSGAARRVGDNFQVAIECESQHEIDSLFDALRQGGAVRLPLDTMPWGARFGMLTDRYGIQWLLNWYLPK